MEKVTIKLLDHADNPKLKVKYVGAIEYATPKLGTDGKIKTGFDENALAVINIPDKKEREKVQARIKKEREDLERLLNVELGPHSSFWDKFFLALTDEEINLDMTNPMDRLKERFLIANRYVAPSFEAIAEDEDFIDCIFYMFREEEETTKSAVKQQLKDKATAKLFLLNEENPNKLKLVASYVFGYNVQVDFSVDTAYTKLREFLDEKVERTQKKNIAAFLEAVEKTPEALKTKLILDKAIKKRIITVRNHIHRRGDLVIGNSYEEALENLSSLEMNSELASLIKQVNTA